MREVQEKDGQTAGKRRTLFGIRMPFIYERHVQAFKDRNADGIGDFPA